MIKGQALRALMDERLTAVAEEIFALFERTIAGYEEELCRSKKENQQLHESISTSKVLQFREEIQEEIPTPTTDTDLNQEITETRVKEEPDEQRVKQEEEELPLSPPQFNAARVKSEGSSLLQQRQSNDREETQGGDIRLKPRFHAGTVQDTEHSSDTDNDDNWGPPYDAEAGDHNRMQISGICTQLSIQNKSVPKTSAAHNGAMSETEKRSDKCQCCVCQKQFTNIVDLQRHTSEHTEIIYSCPICMKSFSQRIDLEGHLTIHTSEKPFSCSICRKSFGRKDCLRNHMRTHTGEKPFSCPTCKKAFADQSNLAVHRRIHTGERPYSCTLCHKTYGNKGCLISHLRTHTGEKLHSCSLCGKRFGKRAYLDVHMRCHTGEKPYICSVCSKAFSVNSNLTRHMKSHEAELK